MRTRMTRTGSGRCEGADRVGLGQRGVGLIEGAARILGSCEPER